MINSTNPISDDILASVNGVKAKKSEAEVAQDRFLTLLVTQMKNQDPLNPLDNAQVTSQLAQLSTVTGIDKLNKTMESMISSVQAGQAYQASALIGKTVLTEGKTFSVEQSQGAFSVDLKSNVDEFTVSIKNAAGVVVRDISLGRQPIGKAPVIWNGFANDGSQAPDGIYTYDVTAKLAGNPVSFTALNYAAVNSVDTESGVVKMKLDNGKSVSTTDIKEIL